MSGYGPDTLNSNIYLQSIPGSGLDFNNVLYLIDEAAGSTLGGDRYRIYYNAQQVDDEPIAEVAAVVKQAAADFFMQPGSKKVLILGRVDTGGGETYVQGLDAVITALGDTASFWGIAIDSRTGADIEVVSADLETDERFFLVYQNDDPKWLTAGYPDGVAPSVFDFTGMEGRERSALSFHDTALEYSDLCVLGNRLDIDPDSEVGQWRCALSAVAALTTALTPAEKTALQGNEGNTGVRWSPKPMWWDTGINHGNRPIEHILSVDWFKDGAELRLATMVQDASVRHEKITVTPAGQEAVANELNAQISLGISAGHLLAESPTDSTVKSYVDPQTITEADITAQQMRFNVQLVLATGVVNFVQNIYARAS